MFKGKTRHLASVKAGESVAKMKLQELLAKERVGPLRRPYHAISQWLRVRSIQTKPSGSMGVNGAVSGLLGENFVLAKTVFSDRRDAAHAVGSALILREKHRPGGRAVVLCYPEDGPAEVIDLARRLGVEFMTPEEFVASVKGDGEAGAAVLA